jgi:single-stranded DNA-binding protein
MAKGGAAMKGIQCAFQGRIFRDADVRTAASGRAWMIFHVAVGEDDRRQFLAVAAFRDSVIDLAGHLVQGNEVYVEGTVKLRQWQDGAELSVAASLVQPMGLIGQKRPKAPRAAPKGRAGGKAKADPYAPTTFADGTSADAGDPLPF